MNHLLPTRTAAEAEAREPVHAVLPVGSFEQHGHHLPLITDTIVAGAITRELEAAYRVFALPPVTISCSHEHQAWRSTVSVSARTLADIVNDVYDSLARSGLRSLTVVSGHGGNYVLSNVVQEASAAGRKMALFPAKDDWKDARRMAGLATSDHEDMHAGELETSIVMYACPELVRDGWQDADWTADDRRDLLTRGIRAYTPSGVIGKPSEASAEKGKAVLDSLTGGFARLLTLFERLDGGLPLPPRVFPCFPPFKGIQETLSRGVPRRLTAAMEPRCIAFPGDQAMRLGINLCFAVNRLTEPEVWAEFVRADLGLDTVQFTFDALDPWWPEIHRGALVRRIRAAADAWDLVIDSASAGRAHSIPAGLLDPDPAARSIARRWWRRACDVAAELGATAVGGPLGTLSPREAADPVARADRHRELLDSIEAITSYAAMAGLREFLIEPAPPARDYPCTVRQSLELFDGLRGRCPIPAGFTLDIGQALFEPRYGPQASAESWISALGASIRMLRVDNSNRWGDPRWGWPHERGLGRAPIAASLHAAGLDGVPAILEVCPRFDEDDEQVRRVLVASVACCRRYLGISPAKEAVRAGLT